MREAAVRAAEEILVSSTLVRLGQDGFAAFMAEITSPDRPVPELTAIFARKPPWQEPDESS